MTLKNYYGMNPIRKEKNLIHFNPEKENYEQLYTRLYSIIPRCPVFRGLVIFDYERI